MLAVRRHLGNASGDTGKGGLERDIGRDVPMCSGDRIYIHVVEEVV